MRVFFIISVMLSGVSANGMPDCSESDVFMTSTYGMLLSALLPINVSSPESDAQINFENGDYRLLGFGDYAGIKIPGSDYLDQNKICEYGVRILPGMTDAFESSEHRVLVEKIRIYIKKYNAYLLNRLGIL